ncbi:MAG TPA: response regulator [Acidimicrobiales bacterium]|nr:response regulator [Acidimicrobiales bacterium]
MNPPLVLIADDDANLRLTAAEILRHEGYEVVEAANGEEALSQLNELPVSIVVLDVRMPKKDGLSVLDALESPPPVVLLISAYEFESDDRARVKSKVFRYLRKPVPPLSLIDAVSEAAAQSSMIGPKHTN